MSIQAVGWALDQDLPARPKLVLVAIANHTDKVTGYCWLRADTIAQEGACETRSVYRYVAALVRNGYLRREKKRSDDGKQRANDYWILFNRAPAEWNWSGPDGEDGDDSAGDADAELHGSDEADPQDIDGRLSQESPGQSDRNNTRQNPEKHAVSPGPSDSGVTHKDSAEPSKTKPEERAPAARIPRGYKPPPAPPPQPVGAIAGAKGEMIFVWDGTPAYDAWAVIMARRNGVTKWHATTTKIVNGESRRGWYFPTLFPKASADSKGTDPPDDPLADERTAVIKKTG